MATAAAPRRSAVLEHMTLALQPILEKGIVDHSIIHRVLCEYMSLKRKGLVEEVVGQLAGPLIPRIVHTRDGAAVAAACIAFSSAKERKKIVKGLKGHIGKIARDNHGNLVLLKVLDVVDDTKLVNKVVMSEINKEAKELAIDKFGRRAFLHLLAPRTGRYFPADVIAALQPPEPTVAGSGTVGEDTGMFKSEDGARSSAEEEEEKEVRADPGTAVAAKPDASRKKRRLSANGDRKGDAAEEAMKDVSEVGAAGEANPQVAEEPEQAEEDDSLEAPVGVASKKDPEVRRLELLMSSGLAKKLTEVCVQHTGELLCSQHGTDIIFEVANGGTGGILWKSMLEGVAAVHAAIAEAAAQPRPETKPGLNGTGPEEHVLDNYFASRTIRRLVLGSLEASAARPFAAVLWETALRGRCSTWAHGHSAKVVAAMCQSRHGPTAQAAKSEIQPLLASGSLDDIKHLFGAGPSLLVGGDEMPMPAPSANLGGGRTTSLGAGMQEQDAPTMPMLTEDDAHIKLTKSGEELASPEPEGPVRRMRKQGQASRATLR